MVLGLSAVDWLIIIALLFFIFEAIGRPFILELLDLFSFLIAFFLSFRYYNLLSVFFENQFKIPHGLSQVLGFMAIWFLAETIFFIMVRVFLKKAPALNFPFSTTLSVIPSFLRGLIFIALMLVILATFPVHPLVKKAVLDSKVGSLILKNAYQLEEPVKQVFGGVTNDTLTFLTIKPRTNESVDLGFQTSNFSTDQEAEQVMLDLLNRERLSRGLRTLSLDVNLRNVARLHSQDMFKRGYFSHYSPEGESVADRAAKEDIDFLVVGENLAYAPNTELAHKGLMNSEGHRANILSEDYGKIGIGVMDGGIYGKMFTQVFSN